MTTKTIRINGVDQDVGSATTFQDFIRNLNQTLGSERKVISSIRVNGHELSEVEERNMSALPMEQLGSIELEVSNPVELAYQTLDTLEQYVDRLITSIERAAAHYRGKNLVAGDAYFSKAIDGLDLFVQTIGGVKLALRLGLNPPIAVLEAELISIMNDLLDAKRQNNYLFMAELLEKELRKNLSEWKESAFHTLRNFRNS